MKLPESRGLELARWVEAHHPGRWVSGRELGAHLREQGLTRNQGHPAIRAAIQHGWLVRKPSKTEEEGRFVYRSGVLA